MKIFANREEAGKRLAPLLSQFATKDAIVLALPRGGVVVGYEIASAYNLPLDVIIPRKIGAPDNPELAIGAVAEDGTTILNERIVNYMNVPESYIKRQSALEVAEIGRRLKLYRGEASYPELKNRQVIIVDDGIATGYTMRAALASARKRGAKSVVMAVPVGPPSTLQELEESADHIVCPLTPESFYAIGQFYGDFTQTTDEEVIDLLKRNRNRIDRK
ncbi:MAG: phosphoribosyltransferase [Smithellaceae bacterium]|nr:phosphoribosyltransferase [Smithellaceae bacterium]